jgi:hypothetical protein
LMMGTFMKVDELLKLNWRARIIKTNNNWLAIFISFSHTVIPPKNGCVEN